VIDVSSSAVFLSRAPLKRQGTETAWNWPDDPALLTRITAKPQIEPATCGYLGRRVRVVIHGLRGLRRRQQLCG